jgi:hypothetical protein
MSNKAHRFKRGNNLYLVEANAAKPQTYVVFRCNENGSFCAADISYRFTTDSSIYDFCDEEEAKTLKRSDTFYKKHIEAKRKAVALFRKK